MPSGKTHDAVTFLLVAPTFVSARSLTENTAIAMIVTVAMLVGGLMFGPDLDTHSKQYTRWGFLCFLWYPYQAFFKHRSRWSHGLLFGTLLRVVYFMGALTLISFAATYVMTTYQGGETPSLLAIAKNWTQIGEWARLNFGEYTFPAAFAGLWLGAASHTMTDMAGSFIKHGRIMEPF
ncbi:MAG: metal-binding protein [Pyrinomonadaceae bacterium]